MFYWFNFFSLQNPIPLFYQKFPFLDNWILKKVGQLNFNNSFGSHQKKPLKCHLYRRLQIHSCRNVYLHWNKAWTPVKLCFSVLHLTKVLSVLELPTMATAGRDSAPQQGYVNKVKVCYVKSFSPDSLSRCVECFLLTFLCAVGKDSRWPGELKSWRQWYSMQI